MEEGGQIDFYAARIIGAVLKCIDINCECLSDEINRRCFFRRSPRPPQTYRGSPKQAMLLGVGFRSFYLKMVGLETTYSRSGHSCFCSPLFISDL
jgi:hypothetical protein